MRMCSTDTTNHSLPEKLPSLYITKAEQPKSYHGLIFSQNTMTSVKLCYVRYPTTYIICTKP